MDSAGIVRRAAVTREGSMDSFTTERTVMGAEGVKGVFTDRRESFVV